MTKPSPLVEVTLREFRAAPAKHLRRAARTKTRLRVGDFVLAVEEAKSSERGAQHHGAMRDTGRIVGDPGDLLSTGDTWEADA